jgi:hypothetical protein
VARSPGLDALAAALGRDGRRSARGARARSLSEPRGDPRHDDRTDQQPEHQRKKRDRRRYQHHTGHALHRHLCSLTATERQSSTLWARREMVAEIDGESR